MIQLNSSFFSSHPRGSEYFMTMNSRSQRGFICLPCALLCGVQARKTFYFVSILNHRNFCFSSRFGSALYSLCHLICSKANKILLDDRLFIHRYNFLTTDEVFLSIEVSNFANETFLKYNECPSAQC